MERLKKLERAYRWSLERPYLRVGLLFFILPVVVILVFDRWVPFDLTSEPILIAILAVLGYVSAHEFEMSRRRREKKMDIFLDLMKSLRFLILEKDVMGTPEQRKLRTMFQEAYYALSLLVSPNGYQALQDMMKKLEPLVKGSILTGQLDAFKVAQQKFINSLREEVSIGGEITFESFDFQLPDTIDSNSTS